MIRDRTRCAWTVRADLARSVAGELGGLARSRRRWRTLGRRRCLRSDRWKTRVRGLRGAAAEPGPLAAGVVQGVVGRVSTESHRGVEDAAFRHTLCIVGTLGVGRAGCRCGFVSRLAAQIVLRSERRGRTGGFDAGGQEAVSQRARIGTAKSPSPKLVQTSPS